MNTEQPVADTAAIRRLFEAAAACGDRYHCPPGDELLARAERPDGTPVAAVAFDLMADPAVRSFDRLGTLAYDVALSWAGARVKAGTFDAAARSRLVAAVRRVLETDSSTFIEPVYTWFAGPVGDATPEAREILVAEATNPHRDLSQVDAAAKVLQRFTPDLSQAREWLESDDERRQQAGLSLLDYMDHRRIPVDQEVALLQKLAQRKGLTSAVALALLTHVEGHGDPAFRPVLDALQAHPDPEVRRRARAAAIAVEQPAG